LESLGYREHARRSVAIANNSFGMPPHDAPAHAREHPESIARRGKSSVAGPLHRPPNEALELPSELLICACSADAFYLVRLQLNSGVMRHPIF
jgi:hypothetical protein